MVSAIGGSLSLYLGVSVSMMFEVFELFIDILIGLFSFCTGRGNNLVIPA